ncbi:MAG: hypothetical protein ACOYXW_17615, partial [Actinomycetota bacterium]
MDPAAQKPMTTREEALARVLAHREHGRSRPAATRVVLAGLGALLVLASVPLVVVLPEFGIPALLVALRLLAVEADWAAKAYAWTDWRFTQARDWFHRQSQPVRGVVVIGLLAV